MADEENWMKEETPYDIKERAFLFAVRIVKMVNGLPRTTAGIGLGRQVIRSGPSIGANLEEADGAESKKDFVHKVGMARKEARETRYWPRLIDVSGLLSNDEVGSLRSESDEFVRILSSIIAKAKAK